MRPFKIDAGSDTGNNVTWHGKTGLIYTKYTCLYYNNYLFCMCYGKSVNFNELLMDFCMYDNILGTITFTDYKSYCILDSQN